MTLQFVEDSWDNDLKQFKLKQNDQENALKVPGDINFSVGDKFILTGLKMPQSYRDNASLQLQEEAQAWLDGKCEKRIQLRGKCDEIVFRLQTSLSPVADGWRIFRTVRYRSRDSCYQNKKVYRERRYTFIPV
mgnify:CR=1 FL=1